MQTTATKQPYWHSGTPDHAEQINGIFRRMVGDKYSFNLSLSETDGTLFLAKITYRHNKNTNDTVVESIVSREGCDITNVQAVIDHLPMIYRKIELDLISRSGEDISEYENILAIANFQKNRRLNA
jgi:hypothetical protein